MERAAEGSEAREDATLCCELRGCPGPSRALSYEPTWQVAHSLAYWACRSPKRLYEAPHLGGEKEAAYKRDKGGQLYLPVPLPCCVFHCSRFTPRRVYPALLDCHMAPFVPCGTTGSMTLDVELYLRSEVAQVGTDLEKQRNRQ